MIASSTASDPFYVAKDEVQTGVKKVKAAHSEWKDLLERTNTAKSRRFADLQSEIHTELSQLEFDLNDMDATIAIVEQNPEKFPGVTEGGELQSRKAFLTNTRSTIAEIRDSLKSKKTLAKVEADKRELLNVADQEKRRKIEQQNERFLGEERETQQQIMRQQDQNLTELSRCAERLNATAHVINNELQDHQRMLQELDEDIDKETEKLNFVMKRIGKLLKTSDSKQLMLIVVLFLLMVFLLFLVINT